MDHLYPPSPKNGLIAKLSKIWEASSEIFIQYYCIDYVAPGSDDKQKQYQMRFNLIWWLIPIHVS